MSTLEISEDLAWSRVGKSEGQKNMFSAKEDV